jgi:hypothetical protein
MNAENWLAAEVLSRAAGKGGISTWDSIGVRGKLLKL